jgi:hypothetical protein
MIESKRRAFEAYNGVDLSTVQGTSTATGKQELTWTTPDLPPASTGVSCASPVTVAPAANALYHAEFFPRATLTDVNEMKFSDNDPLAYAVTMGADTDTTAGYPQRSFWAGPALTTSVMNSMGFSRLRSLRRAAAAYFVGGGPPPYPPPTHGTEVGMEPIKLVDPLTGYRPSSSPSRRGAPPPRPGLLRAQARSPPPSLSRTWSAPAPVPKAKVGRRVKVAVKNK